MRSNLLKYLCPKTKRKKNIVSGPEVRTIVLEIQSHRAHRCRTNSISIGRDKASMEAAGALGNNYRLTYDRSDRKGRARLLLWKTGRPMTLVRLGIERHGCAPTVLHPQKRALQKMSSFSVTSRTSVRQHCAAARPGLAPLRLRRQSLPGRFESLRGFFFSVVHVLFTLVLCTQNRKDFPDSIQLG